VADPAANKDLVRRLVGQGINEGDLGVLQEIADHDLAEETRRWIAPFRQAFPDFSMEIVDLIAEHDRVAAHFRCSGTQLGEWRGVPGTGRRFENVDEIYIFKVTDGRLSAFTAVEDNLTRMRQLGIIPPA
jgi:steroid delta-isomerase-like uncharacterized protein